MGIYTGIKGLIFDLDGTLVDTAPQIRDLCNGVMADLGAPPVNTALVMSMLGEGPKRLIEKLFVHHHLPLDKVEETLALYRWRYDRSQGDKEKIYPGMKEALKKLKDRFLLAVNTNKPESIAPGMMEDFFPGIFSPVVGETQIRRRKPSPDGVKVILNAWNLKPDEVLYIGDTAVDILTGHAAGLKVIGVTWGFREERVLIEAGADYIFHHPLDLCKNL